MRSSKAAITTRMEAKPSLKQRRRESRNEAILDAAELLFAQQGFAGARFEEIASAACISKPTLYSHYGSKEEIAVGLAVRYLRQVTGFLKSQDPATDPGDRLRRFIDWAVEFRFGGRAKFVYSLAQYVTPLQPMHTTLSECEGEVLEELASLIREGQSAGKVRNDIDAACLAGLMLSSQYGHLDNLLAAGRLTLPAIVQAWTALLAVV